MIIENTEALKSWLNQNLSRICEADPAALAKYILALVKKDKTEAELKAFCLDQLEVFLSQETKSFVEVLFEALKSKSYLHLQNESAIVPSPSNKSPIKNNEASPIEPAAKSETEKITALSKDVTVNQTKFTQNSDSRTKSNGSPDHKSSRTRYRSRSRDNDRRPASDEDRTNKSKNFDSRRRKYDYYSNRNDRSVRDKRNDRHKYSKRGRSRSNSRSRSRSWSSRSSSRSPSRGRSPSPKKNNENNDGQKKQMQKMLMDSVGDTDYRMNMRAPKSTIVPTNNYAKHISKRCQDYDERGYCLKGEYCCFDHGASPILVDDVSAINFNVGSEERFEGPHKMRAKSPMPPLPPTPPPAPPLPPMPPPMACVTEPYNPESPAMFPPHPGYFVPPPMHMPPPPIQPHPLQVFAKNAKPPPRVRELIGVPTVSNLEAHAIPGVVPHDKEKMAIEDQNDAQKPPPTTTTSQKDFNKRRNNHFDFNRLGPRRNQFNRTLELRKVPRHLNSISHLNDYFSKFGQISNIQIQLDGDPEAAMVQFASHVSAQSAYRCTDAVLNNRFIKLFFSNKDSTAASGITHSTPLAEIQDEKTNSTQENVASAAQTPNISEKAAAFKSLKSRTVYIPSVKKSFALNNNKVENVPKVHKPPKLKEDKLKNAFQMKMSLHKKKQEFLQQQMENQKVMLDKLSNSKSEKEKAFLFKTMETMSAKISVLKKEMIKEGEELKNLLKAPAARPPVSKTDAEKELLDAEMDLYNKQHKGIDTAALLSKVHELKQKAKALGILDNLPHPVNPVRRRNSRILGSSAYMSSNLSRVDHRPKKLLVAGFSEKNALLKHLLGFGKVESIDEHPEGFVINYNSRQEAENAALRGTKLGDTTLKFSWYRDPAAPPNPDNGAVGEKEGDEVEEELKEPEEEEDEEEDGEARSWRR